MLARAGKRSRLATPLSSVDSVAQMCMLYTYALLCSGSTTTPRSVAKTWVKFNLPVCTGGENAEC
jgi:hypothetical protein